MVRFPFSRSLAGAGTVLVTLAMWPGLAAAQPVHMQESSPAAEAIVHGDHAQYVVRFDGPVNHLASRLEITRDGKVVQTLHPLTNAAVDVLFASGAVPAAGHYMLHWDAVCPDGERSMGDIPFTVQ
jgi:methionine-rich copper-binding protein CopC